MTIVETDIAEPASVTDMRAALTKTEINGCVLLVEVNPAHAEMILETLAAATDDQFHVEWVTEHLSGLDRLRKGGVEAVLIDLVLADSQSIETIEKRSLAAVHVPILSLSGIDTAGIAGQAVERGAQHYLLDDRLDSYSLTQTLRSIIDRRAGEEMLFIEKEHAQVTLNSLGDAVLYFEGSPGPRRRSDQRLVPPMAR